MRAEEGKDAAPCQGAPAGETAWDTLLHSSSVPTTPVPTKAPHSPGLGEVTWVLCQPHLSFSSPSYPPCGTPSPDGATYCTGYMHDRLVYEGQSM
ncbi:DNA polymerase [Dissostichus eleginoides]|uniref:DNA polymerase n=1 Tax=Dissostichus eleginoides TaxID=100907 RepID=A0AAD9BWV4_DISEL|nr:DNA polymerase [Dissostichus eleginoides]